MLLRAGPKIPSPVSGFRRSRDLAEKVAEPPAEDLAPASEPAPAPTLVPPAPDDRIARLEGQLAELLARSEYATKEETAALNQKIDGIASKIEEAMRQPVMEPPPPPIEPTEATGAAAGSPEDAVAPTIREKTFKPKVSIF